MFELGAQGVEERDEATLVKGAAKGVTLVASYEDEKAAKRAKTALGKDARIEEIVGDAWRDAWKEHFRPFRLCQGDWVRPPWEEHTARRGEVVLVLEPGRAFGTGLHETTRLVAEAIAMLSKHNTPTVLDVGTGSGILTLVALVMGAKHVTAIDVDADAVEVAKENAARNGMGDRTAFSTTSVARVRGEFGLVLANIEADVLISMKDALKKRVAAGGRLVLSGILASREKDVRAAFGKPLARSSLGEWIALTYAFS